MGANVLGATSKGRELSKVVKKRGKFLLFLCQGEPRMPASPPGSARPGEATLWGAALWGCAGAGVGWCLLQSSRAWPGIGMLPHKALAPLLASVPSLWATHRLIESRFGEKSAWLCNNTSLGLGIASAVSLAFLREKCSPNPSPPAPLSPARCAAATSSDCTTGVSKRRTTARRAAARTFSGRSRTMDTPSLASLGAFSASTTQQSMRQ